MEKAKTNELLKEWLHRVSFVRAEILDELRTAPKPDVKTVVQEGGSFSSVGEIEGPFAEARDRQIENEIRISQIEESLKEEGVDPYKVSVASLIFVDTESSNCFGNVYKMCEYGQCVTDASFNEITKGRKDILINPGKDGRFFLRGRKGHRDLVLAHSEAKYRRSPFYEEFHNDISFYLRQPSSMVFMWASENDIQALLDQSTRYKLPYISFVSYDVQRIFRKEFPDYKGLPSLEKAAEFLGISLEGITQHRPDDDAYLTMLILKAIVEKTGKTVMELIRDCPSCQNESVRKYKDMQARHKAKEERVHLDNERKKAMAPYNAELNAIFDRGVPEDAPWEKTFSTSTEMKIHIDETLGRIKGWLERGFFLKRNLNVPYLVAYNEEDRDHLKSILNTDKLKIVLIDEFDAVTTLNY